MLSECFSACFGEVMLNWIAIICFSNKKKIQLFERVSQVKLWNVDLLSDFHYIRFDLTLLAQVYMNSWKVIEVDLFYVHSRGTEIPNASPLFTIINFFFASLEMVTSTETHLSCHVNVYAAPVGSTTLGP